jgi:purine-binding chemotaxis protein CheW
MTAMAEGPGRQNQFVTFEVGGHLFGVEALNVLEVFGRQVITEVPLSPPAVAGLTNLRGEVVTVLDLRHRLGLGRRPAGAQPVSVIVASEDGAVSLLVDNVGDVVDVPEGSFEETPSTMTRGLRELIQGAYKLSETLLLSLDVGRVVDVRAGSSPPSISRSATIEGQGAPS